MTPKSDITTELIELVRTELAVDAPHIGAESRLIGDLGLDSVAFAISLVAIEERFGVRLSEKELVDSETIGDVAATISRRRSAEPDVTTAGTR